MWLRPPGRQQNTEWLHLIQDFAVDILLSDGAAEDRLNTESAFEGFFLSGFGVIKTGTALLVVGIGHGVDKLLVFSVGPLVVGLLGKLKDEIS